MGLQHMRCGHEAEGAARYAQALQIDPGHADTLMELGKLRHSHGQGDEAFKCAPAGRA